jgi:fatty-acyl-CoA synthase
MRAHGSRGHDGDSVQPVIRSNADLRRLEERPLADWDLPSSSYALLRDAAARFGNDCAIEFLPAVTEPFDTVVVSYRQLLAGVTRTANALAALGVGRDTAVGIVLPNFPETHFALWGAQTAGIACPINPLLEARQIAGIAADAGCRVLITLGPVPGQDIYEKCRQAAAELPDLEHLVIVDPLHAVTGGAAQLPPDTLPGDAHLFHELLAAAEAEDLRLSSGPTLEDIAACFHTGGTTGRPKLAVLTQGNEVASSFQMSLQFLVDGQQTLLAALPLFHANGAFVTGLSAFRTGSRLLLATPAGFRGEGVLPRFWNLVEHFGVNAVSAVPTILARLLEGVDRDSVPDCLRYVLCGAAPLAPALEQRWLEATGVPILEGYGLTEATCATHTRLLHGAAAPGTVGPVVPYCEALILDPACPDVSNSLAPGEVGLIAIRGPNVFRGYLREADNALCWLAPGLLNTGDLGYLDPEGCLYVTGRQKDLIIRGGHNIDPAEIEATLQGETDVIHVAAVGAPHAELGEVPVAFVELSAGSELDEAALLALIRERIGERAAIPQRVFLVDSMPLTAIGKIYKPDLRERAAAFEL